MAPVDCLPRGGSASRDDRAGGQRVGDPGVSGVPRHLVVTALDALEDGDQAHAAAVLLAGLEDGDSDTYTRPNWPPRCPVCGQHAWPGDHARHVYTCHHARRAA